MGRKAIIGYAAYTMVCMVIFVFVLFPGEKAGEWLAQTINHHWQGGRMTLERLSLRPPLAVAAHAVTVHWPEKTDVPDLLLDRFEMRPVWSSFFRDMPALTFEARCGQGEARGRVMAPLSLTSGLGQLPDTCRVMGEFDGVHVTRFHYHASDVDATFSFNTRGHVDVNIAPGTGPRGTGHLTLTDFSIDLDHQMLAVMGMTSFHFSTVRMVLEIKAGRLEIHDFKATGPEMHIELAGAVSFGRSFSQGRLDMTGHVKPDAAWLADFSQLPSLMSVALKRFKGKGLTFHIKGTPSHPQVTL